MGTQLPGLVLLDVVECSALLGLESLANALVLARQGSLSYSLLFSLCDFVLITHLKATKIEHPRRRLIPHTARIAPAEVIRRVGLQAVLSTARYGAKEMADFGELEDGRASRGSRGDDDDWGDESIPATATSSSSSTRTAAPLSPFRRPSCLDASAMWAHEGEKFRAQFVEGCPEGGWCRCWGLHGRTVCARLIGGGGSGHK